MRKLLISIIGFFLLINLVFSEENYNLGEKDVVGKDKRDYKEELDLKSNKIKIKDEKLQIKLKDEKLKFLKSLNIKNIKIKNDVSESELKYNIYVYNTPKVIMKSEDKKSKNYDNYITFGLGGYKGIDAFKYIIDYTNDDKEKDLTYFLHLGREIKGEDRRNDNESTDNYFVKLWHKNMNLALSHIIINQNFPGKDNATAKVDTFKEEKKSEINFNSDVIIKKSENLNIGLDAFFNQTKSVTAPIREYNNRYYNVYGKYIKLLKEDFMEFNLEYFSDGLDDFNLNSIRVKGNDKLKLKKYGDINLDLGVALEVANVDGVGEQNYKLKVSGDKSLSDIFSVNFNIMKNSLREVNKDILSGFEFGNDVLPYSSLENEDIFKTGFGSKYGNEKLNVEAGIIYNFVKNKIIYAEEDSKIANEIPISVINSKKNLNWWNLTLNSNYKYNNYLRGDVSYTYSNLENISFNPSNRVVLNVVYEKNNLKSRLEGKFYSKMYGKEDEKSYIGLYKTLNLYNVYRFSESMDISLNILNLFNYSENKKSNYPVDSRKIMLEFKMNY
ncbi:TonB-dependent receptor [Haliovirga abyssi]|uniref:TonB-dependent receptor n=1 Tax=Haliovirga abyssi TaxID=2996794 RepID=A0AAU9DZI2_9FUSO|nr:TonB-dependent receptor [Haliovirga abyssi]BDU50975.1 hypothetical protein HLVA_15440 [Haliovirga abyssi]